MMSSARRRLSPLAITSPLPKSAALLSLVTTTVSLQPIPQRSVTSCTTIAIGSHRAATSKDRLSGIRCPVLAVGVFEDAVLDADATMEIAEALDPRPDFRLYMYTGYGHAAFDTAPDYRDRMRRFLLD